MTILTTTLCIALALFAIGWFVFVSVMALVGLVFLIGYVAQAMGW